MESQQNNTTNPGQTPVQAPHEEPKTPHTALKVGVLLILIVLLVVGILLPIKLVPNAISSLTSSVSSFFSRKDTTVTISTTPEDITSGQPFAFTWSGTYQTGGSYAISYDCVSGVNIQTVVNDANETIACGTPFYFSTPGNSLPLTAISTMNRSIDIPVTLSFLANGATTTDTVATSIITIANATSSTPTLATTQVATTTSTSTITQPIAASTTIATTSPASTPTPSKNSGSSAIVTKAHIASNLNGTPDLAITITGFGYLTDAGQFVPAQVIPTNGRVAVTFIVKNIGTKNTGLWSFIANLPTLDHPTFTASNQQNLGPGDSIHYTLGYDNFNPSASKALTITADPTDAIHESNLANNSASITINNY